MDVCLVIRERLARLGLEQKDLAAAAEVTESYISQLLTRKKLPPAPDRTDIYKQMRVRILEFLDTDVFHVSLENCVAFLDPLIDSWDIDLSTFGMNIVLNRRLAPGHSKRFEFAEAEPNGSFGDEPGLIAFLKDASLRGNVTQEEIEF